VTRTESRERAVIHLRTRSLLQGLDPPNAIKQRPYAFLVNSVDQHAKKLIQTF
jgi:hypothetical protein